jgi:hypothetical protein
MQQMVVSMRKVVTLRFVERGTCSSYFIELIKQSLICICSSSMIISICRLCGSRVIIGVPCF